jgi:hypothetical protein
LQPCPAIRGTPYKLIGSRAVEHDLTDPVVAGSFHFINNMRDHHDTAKGLLTDDQVVWATHQLCPPTAGAGFKYTTTTVILSSLPAS